MPASPFHTQAQLAAVLETVGEGILTVDARQRIRFVNPAAAEIFGRTPEEMLECSLHELMPPRYHKRHDKAFQAKVRGRDHSVSTHARALEGRRADGSLFPLELRFTSFKIGGQLFFTAAVRDISDRKEAEAELERRSDEIARLNRQLSRERDYLREEVKADFQHIIGESPALGMVMSRLDVIAPSDVTVLITGESGVGKELFARAVHERSGRSGKALVRVNCASITDSLFESEFFGHAKGAFTGAHSAREGRFQLADGGTLFLDEIGEVPLALQGKLLRVIQEQEFERVGESKTRRVDVRLVAATNRDLRREVEEGRFRSDLFFRLGVFPLQVPPLRERHDDLWLLAEHFLEHIADKLHAPPAYLSQGARDAMRVYTWPGNVRELRNVMERGSLLARGGEISLDMLGLTSAPESFTELGGHRRPVRTHRPPSGPGRTEVLSALQAHDWVVARAARGLGISRQALYRRMEKYGLS